MYAQCDPDGNQYILLADIDDHRGMDNATKFKDQTLLKLRNNAKLMKIDHEPAYWADAIATEMKNVRAAFTVLPDGSKAPNGYQRINCYMGFDVKMEDF